MRWFSVAASDQRDGALEVWQSANVARGHPPGGAAGVALLGVRGVQNNRSQPLHMVAASVELEGALPAIRDMVRAIESQTPFLFVTEASFRSIADGDGGPIRAELKVQGAMRGDESRPEETTSQ